MMIEILKANDYYHRRTPGHVVLVNGQPHHFEMLKEARAFAAKIAAVRKAQTE